MNQIKIHKDKTTRKAKAKACLYAAVSPAIFSRIMACQSVKAIWDFLKAEYQGDERIKGIKVLNLIREFERLMKESETIKEYSDKLIGIANKVSVTPRPRGRACHYAGAHNINTYLLQNTVLIPQIPYLYKRIPPAYHFNYADYIMIAT